MAEPIKNQPLMLISDFTFFPNASLTYYYRGNSKFTGIAYMGSQENIVHVAQPCKFRTRVRNTTIRCAKHGSVGAHCGDRFFSRSSSSSTFKLSTHFSSTSFMSQKSPASGCEPSSQQQRNGDGCGFDCALLMGRRLACRKPGCFGNGSRPF